MHAGGWRELSKLFLLSTASYHEELKLLHSAEQQVLFYNQVTFTSLGKTIRNLSLRTSASLCSLSSADMVIALVSSQ